uniref:CobQ/CobB/MinD/ParA nucleotide binding domain-containing protein n=1 Tax=Candidatus Kentrum eta TaxID=2126337 RepID=A0A450USB2_9GAMM|nr:MAG: CobQ/CobB/MinD/ParA nucleotide binding domain-containing protein [Candidatus Kentron sp. H]VFJ88231.1 MAG: CobQ/CobB/MinD/ParA nucleotide binding domain-containing protein [Candidatus Kentron sp. H]VFJ95454.1 MAG: CobQ/CobB/MinD/ParA nucleotide binding domain-containing protein [Candidatus Kentron sp. H]
MKTLIFHSVKGGVGRTLALCNVARALADIGKRVLMLDFDYTAPGLHYKFGKPSASGYMEYLEEFDVEARTGGVADKKRWRSLEKSIEEIDKNLHLLRAGDEGSANFWGFISSHLFHRLFYTTPNDVNGLKPSVFPEEWLDRNIRAFEADKRLIEEHLASDYLLVDCKTSLDGFSAFFLLDWADTVVHFFSVNPEGIRYACGTAAALVRHMADETEKHRQIGFIPVVSRVPNHAGKEEEESYRNAVRSEWRRKRWKGKERDLAANFFQTEDFVFLSEMSQLEAKERILFNWEDRRDPQWKLSHDYLSLCARAAPKSDRTCFDENESWRDESENWWYEHLGMNPNTRILAKEFDSYLHLGTMLNVDAQPNIAMRVRTFHLLMGGVLGSEDNTEKQKAALREAGRRCGEDFGKELSDTFKREQPSLELRQRIESWAEFDSGVGFGAIHVLDAPANDLKGWLLVAGDAFDRPEVGLSDDEIRDLRGFFEGYVAGVLTEIHRGTDRDLGNIQVRGITEAQTPEHVRHSATEKGLQVGSYYEFSGDG